MHPTKGTQVGPQCRPSPFTGVAVDLASAIAIIIPRPLVHTMAHGRLAWMAASVALPLVGKEDRAASGNMLRDQARAGARVGMVADPEPMLARGPRHHTDDRGAVIRLVAGARTLHPSPLCDSVHSQTKAGRLCGDVCDRYC
jgi:hypothetical protein